MDGPLFLEAICAHIADGEKGAYPPMPADINRAGQAILDRREAEAQRVRDTQVLEYYRSSPRLPPQAVNGHMASIWAQLATSTANPQLAAQYRQRAERARLAASKAVSV